MKPGAGLVFQVEGYDQYDRPMAVETVVWHADGGTIDSTGRFTAGRSEGLATIEAAVGSQGDEVADRDDTSGPTTTPHGAARSKVCPGQGK